MTYYSTDNLIFGMPTTFLPFPYKYEGALFGISMNSGGNAVDFKIS